MLSTCGVLFHQTYNQLLPDTEHELADKAKDKRLLGYHDIRIGNEPDNRLTTFVTTNLPQTLPEARDRFDDYKNLLADFAAKTIRAYARPVGRFLAWCEAQGIELRHRDWSGASSRTCPDRTPPRIWR